MSQPIQTSIWRTAGAALCLLALLLVTAVPSSAQLVFSLGVANPDIEPGAAGGEVIFSGTITNTGVADLFLNQLTLALNPPADSFLTLDSNVFFASVPGLFSPGDTYTGPIFGVTLDSSTPPGLYLGSVSLVGGADQNAASVLGSAGFGVNTVPDPTGMAVFAVGGLTIGAATRLRKRRSLRID